MIISLRWLNSFLDRPCSLQEVEHVCTFAGFPIESAEHLPTGDVRLDVEITSNRGDCLCHLGLAREIAAVTGRALRIPSPPSVPTGRHVADALSLSVRTPDVCPRFTASVIENATVRPSPPWLVEQLQAVGQRPISAPVDVTNWLNFAFGHPAHVFDLDKLQGRSLIVRRAHEGEPLTTLDGRARRCSPDDLVVADAQHAASLAGVIGGADSEVSADTRSIVLEVATWDPATVRRTARRHQIRTDASHRFERLVDPRPLADMNRLAAALIADLTGGTLCEGILIDGAPDPEPRTVTLRPRRCAAVIGADVPADDAARILDRLGCAPTPAGDALRCTIPPWRHADLTREIDLIEEIARIRGYDAVPFAPRLSIAVRHPQESERAADTLADTLAALGFYETITLSFVTQDHARLFLPDGLATVHVDEQRRPGAPFLRTSIVPSLLACLRLNHDARNATPDGIRLFETASVYAQRNDPPETVERRNLALVLETPGASPGKRPSPDALQHALRLLRGAIESVASSLAGPDARLTVQPAPPPCPAWDPAAFGTVSLGGSALGVMGLIAPDTLAAFDLPVPVAAAELDYDALLALYPPRATAHPLPAFPGIERDLSFVLDESVPWERVLRTVLDTGLDHLESCRFVGTYRGKQIGQGRKSLTLRLAFRATDRTLRHEEVEPQVQRTVHAVRETLGGALRA